MSGNNPGGAQGNFPPQAVHPVQVFPSQAVLSGQVHAVPAQAALHAAQALPIQPHPVQHAAQQHTVQPHPVQPHPVQPHPVQPHAPDGHSTQPLPSQNFSNPSSQQSTAAQPTVNHPPPHPNQPIDTDPLVKYQQLLPILKESVVNLIKNTVSILQNISNGSCKQSEMQQLNKCMEDFYNISDQVHHWLVLADTTVGHYLMGTCFSTEVTSLFNTQQVQQAEGAVHKDVLFYSQFLSNAKRHVAASSKLRNMLTEFADELGTGS